MKPFTLLFGFVLNILALAAVAPAQTILDAARDGDLERVKVLVGQDKNAVYAADERRCTALHFACDKGFLEIARYLLDHGASLTAKDVDGDLPLHWAAYAGKAEVAGLLIERGAEIEAINRDQNTALHYATRNGHSGTVALLLEKGANVDAQTRGGVTPVILATLRDDADLVRQLHRAGADLTIKDNYGRDPMLLVARETGSENMAKLLIELGASVNVSDRAGDTPLGLATWRGFAGLVDIFLDAGAALPTDKEKSEALSVFAAERGVGRLFILLVNRGLDLSLKNLNGGSLLHSACAGGSKEAVEVLLAKGLDVNERDRYGWTPLHYAAKKGRVEAARLLLAGGAKVDVRTIAGYTPLGQALEFEQVEVARLLKEHGAKAEPVAFSKLKGKYLGQKPPGKEPVLFAPDIVSSNRFEHATVTFSPDGEEAFWGSSFMLSESGYTYGRILTSRLENGRWTVPQKAAFSTIRGCGEPMFTPDGKKLFFSSRRPLRPGGEEVESHIWMVEKTSAGWTEPTLLRGGPNDFGYYWQFSFAADGSIYFSKNDAGGHGGSDIYVSRLIGVEYQPPENLGPVINGEQDDDSPFIASDERYLIFTSWGRPGGIGDADLVVSFRDHSGAWTQPVVLPQPVNSESREICPQVTRDGKYLFFNSFRSGVADNYWVEAAVIEKQK